MANSKELPNAAVIRNAVRQAWVSLVIIACLSFSCFGEDLFGDDEEIVFEDPAVEISGPSTQASKTDSVLAKFLDDSTVTLEYAFSYGTDTPKRTIENEISARLDYETLINGFYLKFDGKSMFHLENDHVARAKDKAVFIDGRIREIYTQKGGKSASLAFGKFIRVWGKADAAVVTDVLAPRDFSRYLFVELEDARTGQWMAAANVYPQNANLLLFVSPFPGTDIEPTDGSRYHRELPGGSNFKIREDAPSFGDTEFGGKFDKTVDKTDFSLMAGAFYANSPVYHTTGEIEDGRRVLEKRYPEFLMAGGAVAHAWQSFLFKLELAYKHDYSLQGVNAMNFYTVEKKDLIDAAAGLEYNANDKYRVYLELANRTVTDGTKGLAPGTDENSSAVYTTFTKDFLNQTLEFEYAFYHHIQEQNQFHKLRLVYDVTDNIEVTAEAAFFNIKDENSLMWAFKDEDRVGIQIAWYF